LRHRNLAAAQRISQIEQDEDESRSDAEFAEKSQDTIGQINP
jgi:hypothetical protein